MQSLKVTAACVVLVSVSIYVRVRREPPVPAASVAHVDSTARGFTRSSRPILSGDRRTEFEVLLANVRAAREAGADCLSYLQRIAQTRPALAIELALTLAADNDERTSWVSELTRAWARRDPQAA